MAGASGMIGTYLSSYLGEYELLNISRKDLQLLDEDFAYKYRECDIVINLSGAPVIRRWTKGNRKEILDSRILTTRKLGSIMKYHPGRERFYLSASAIGIYNDKDIHTEESHAWSEGFMAEVVQKWETEVHLLESAQTKIGIMRIGIVLSAAGGMLAKLLPFFRVGLGARIGKGDQYFSWIHIKDLARAILFILDNKKTGIYNMTAPGFCTNREFTKSLGRIVKKPARLIIPKIVFSMLYGRAAILVTGGQAVVPEKMLKGGFQFNYHFVDKALEDIVN